MIDVDIIFTIAGLGILISVLNIILKQADKEEQAQMLTLAGVVVVLIMVVQLINELFDVVRTNAAPLPGLTC
jgi:stage III sporulation protein AC